MDPAQACPTSLPVALHIALTGGAHLVITDAVQVQMAAQLIKALA